MSNTKNQSEKTTQQPQQKTDNQIIETKINNKLLSSVLNKQFAQAITENDLVPVGLFLFNEKQNEVINCWHTNIEDVKDKIITIVCKNAELKQSLIKALQETS